MIFTDFTSSIKTESHHCRVNIELSPNDHINKHNIYSFFIDNIKIKSIKLTMVWNPIDLEYLVPLLSVPLDD